jgi:DNA-binding CsgD family transcriptional regulator
VAIAEAEAVPTRRQLDCLVMHAEGMTFEEIGRRIHIAPRTVESDLTKLRGVLKATSLSNALVRAVGKGYICVDGRACEAFIPDEFAPVAA